MSSNTTNSFRIDPLNFNDKRVDKVKVMVCQLNFDLMDFEKKSRLCFVANSSKNKEYLRKYLNIASKQQVDLLVFPELTIPTEFVNELREFSMHNDIFIIGGTHYKKTRGGYLSICPIVTPSDIYYTEKTTPASLETSSFVEDADGAVPGEKVTVFQETRIGNFAVTICLDYTNRDLKYSLYKYGLDFLIVTAFNSKSDTFFHSMESEIQDSEEGLYIIYSNTLAKSKGGEGRSALFAFVNDCYKSEFREKNHTDSNFSNKIYEFTDDKSYCIFELDIKHKRPYKSNNWHTTSNVKVLMEDNNKMDKRFNFLQAIGASDNKYMFIDQYYVKPREYKEMMDLLERDNVLVITGDPGIGKTYTAVHFLWEYYKKGFKPIWFYGMATEDSDTRKISLMNYEPQQKNVVYIEDPFGRSVFENREELKTLFGNLVQKFRACKAKLIITSRTEVFKQFEKESLNRDKLEDFKKELNVRNPSYGKEELKRIAKQYMEAYTNWMNNQDIVNVVINGITSGKLISPLMIFNLVKNHSESQDKELLKTDLEKALVTDLVTQFADEIKSLSTPTKILLYLVLLYERNGQRTIANYKEMFEKVQRVIFDMGRFDESSFYHELKGQENHRIQRYGEKKPCYRFSHPTYEEALIVLSMNDATCALIAEKCMRTILKEDSRNAAMIFKRFLSHPKRYPKFLEIFFQDMSPQDFDKFSEMDKMVLIRRMSLSDIQTFHVIAQKIYPIEKLIEGLYSNEDNNLLELRIKTLNARKNEIGTTIIEWSRVFTTNRISRMHPRQFLFCCGQARAIDENLIQKIECNLQKTDIIKKFILIPTLGEREKLNQLLSATKFNYIYMDLKDKLPETIMVGKVDRRNYYAPYYKHRTSRPTNKVYFSAIINEFIFNNEQPKGYVYLDDGAKKAVERNANLYPIGVMNVMGDFVNGDIVYLIHEKSNSRIMSLTEMSSDDIKKYKGLHSSQIYEIAEQIVPTVVSRSFHREPKFHKIEK